MNGTGNSNRTFILVLNRLLRNSSEEKLCLNLGELEGLYRREGGKMYADLLKLIGANAKEILDFYQNRGERARLDWEDLKYLVQHFHLHGEKK